MSPDDEKRLWELSERIASLESRIGPLEKIPAPLELEATLQENRRTRYEETGEWARHYSTVRLTVTTFLASMSIGILSFKWDPPAQPAQTFVDLAGLVWIAALFLFVLFTSYTYCEMENARRHRNWLLVLRTEQCTKKELHLRQDAASWLVLILTILYGIFLLNLCATHPVWHWRLWSFDYWLPPRTISRAMLVCAAIGIIMTFLGPALRRTRQP